MFLKSKKMFATYKFLVIFLGFKIAVSSFLLLALLHGCNKGKFGSGGNSPSRARGVSIQLKKLTNSSTTGKGTGQLHVRANYPLSVTCTNCPDLGVNLVFVDAPRDGIKYVHTADFEYALVEQTEVCALTLSILSRDSNKINTMKEYNVYVCPRQGMSEACDTAKAVSSCANLGR